MKLRSKIVTFLACFGILLTGCVPTGEFVTSISLKAAEDSKTVEGYDMVLDLDKTGRAEFTYNPKNAKNVSFKWTSSDSKIVSTSTISGENAAKLNAKAVGEATITVSTTNTKDGTKLESNKLKVKVNGSDVKTNDDFVRARTTYGLGDKEKPLTINTIYTNTNAPHLDSLTTQNVLVVPFGFEDPITNEFQTQETIERIRKTFFGTTEEMQALGAWESLASFYKKSSYGLSDFQGEVLPTWCVYEGTGKEFKTKYPNQGIGAAEYARKWYLEEYEKEEHGALGVDAKPITYFDANNDGFIDLIWIVYSYPTDRVNQDWWAYVTYSSNNKNMTKPAVKTLGWASIDWMNKGCAGYDPHTFIHETGHTYGLNDYYDYNNSWKPMGGVDFMDHNLGDHCMYSKWLLGWTSPWVVDDSAEITLRPGTTTGDCFIIPSQGYNGTVFDEYIMVELMAPVGLAEQDYKNGYENTTGFSEPGLRITHVDARVHGGNHDVPLTNNPELGKDIRVCNTKGGRSGPKYDTDWWTNDEGDKHYYTETQLIESTVKDTNSTNNPTYNATNSSLFKKGHRFNLSGNNAWAQTFMPSESNLWNKAKTITSWRGKEQNFTIDEEISFNYSLSVIEIKQDAEYGYVAKVRVTANAY